MVVAAVLYFFFFSYVINIFTLFFIVYQLVYAFYSFLRKFAACSFEVKLRLFQAFCTSFYCAHLWYKFTKHVMSKVRVAYNNVFRLLFGYRRSYSASEMFVYNNIYNFEGRLRKNINDFTMRIGSSSNVLIATLRENSFILAGPLRQKWITSVYTIYN